MARHFTWWSDVSFDVLPSPLTRTAMKIDGITQFIVEPTRHDFPEDFKSPAIEHGLYANICRNCRATIQGHKYRRTCRVCLEIFKKQTQNEVG